MYGSLIKKDNKESKTKFKNNVNEFGLINQKFNDYNIESLDLSLLKTHILNSNKNQIVSNPTPKNEIKSKSNNLRFNSLIKLPKIVKNRNKANCVNTVKSEGQKLRPFALQEIAAKARREASILKKKIFHLEKELNVKNVEVSMVRERMNKLKQNVEFEKVQKITQAKESNNSESVVEINPSIDIEENKTTEPKVQDNKSIPINKVQSYEKNLHLQILNYSPKTQSDNTLLMKTMEEYLSLFKEMKKCQKYDHEFDELNTNFGISKCKMNKKSFRKLFSLEVAVDLAFFILCKCRCFCNAKILAKILKRLILNDSCCCEIIVNKNSDNSLVDNVFKVFNELNVADVSPKVGVKFLKAINALSDYCLIYNSVEIFKNFIFDGHFSRIINNSSNVELKYQSLRLASVLMKDFNSLDFLSKCYVDEGDSPLIQIIKDYYSETKIAKNIKYKTQIIDFFTAICLDQEFEGPRLILNLASFVKDQGFFESIIESIFHYINSNDEILMGTNENSFLIAQNSVSVFSAFSTDTENRKRGIKDLDGGECWLDEDKEKLENEYFLVKKELFLLVLLISNADHLGYLVEYKLRLLRISEFVSNHVKSAIILSGIEHLMNKI